MDEGMNDVRDLQKEIKDLEVSKNIKLLGLETFDGILTGPLVETAIDSLENTLRQINLDDIAAAVNKDLEEYRELRGY
jgi:hypothetical protein